MSRKLLACVPAVVLLGAGLAWFGPCVIGQATPLQPVRTNQLRCTGLEAL